MTAPEDCPEQRDHALMEECGSCSYTVRDLLSHEERFWRDRATRAAVLATHARTTAARWPLMTGQQRADAVNTWSALLAGLNTGHPEPPSIFPDWEMEWLAEQERGAP